MFVSFFTWILCVQLFVLFAILLFKGFVPQFGLDEKIITTYMSSVFIETLGVITIMITFSIAAVNCLIL